MTSPADTPSRTADDHAWETADAPKISTTRMVLTVGVFVLWLAFLAWMSARRWFGSLL